MKHRGQPLGQGCERSPEAARLASVPHTSTCSEPKLPRSRGRLDRSGTAKSGMGSTVGVRAEDDMEPLHTSSSHGPRKRLQSIWLDYFRRGLITCGGLHPAVPWKRAARRDGISYQRRLLPGGITRWILPSFEHEAFCTLSKRGRRKPPVGADAGARGDPPGWRCSGRSGTGSKWQPEALASSQIQELRSSGTRRRTQ
jgi:hypothetical protein